MPVARGGGWQLPYQPRPGHGRRIRLGPGGGALRQEKTREIGWPHGDVSLISQSLRLLHNPMVRNKQAEPALFLKTRTSFDYAEFDLTVLPVDRLTDAATAFRDGENGALSKRS